MPGAAYLDRIIAIQGIRNRRNSQFRRVAIPAKVTEHDMPESRGARFSHEIGGGAVGKVAVRRHDALLDGKRAPGVGLEQLLVVVGFDEETIHFGHMMEKGSRDMTEIGENADGKGLASDSETHRVDGIVRDGKSGHLEGLQRKRAAGGEEPPIRGRIALVMTAHLIRGQTRGVDWTTQGLEQNRQSARVVAMFVGQQDGGDLLRIETRGAQSFQCFSGAESCINQDGRVTRAEHAGVAAAATAKDDEFHGARLVPRDRGDKSAFSIAAIRLKSHPCSSTIAC